MKICEIRRNIKKIENPSFLKPKSYFILLRILYYHFIIAHFIYNFI